MIKVLIVGHWHWEIYEEAFKNGLKSLGHDVLEFKLDKFYSRKPLCRLQIRAKNGPLIWKINRSLVSYVIKTRPNIIFMHQPDLIYPSTIKSIKYLNKNIKIKIYHNDNPYIGFKNRLKWRHFLNSIKFVDHLFVYRPENIKKGMKLGAKSVSLLLPSYVSYRHIPAVDYDDKCIDVIFIGHYEKKKREEYLNYLICNGIDVKIYGTDWKKSSYVWAQSDKIRLVSIDEYAKLISSAKIGLVFLSEKNRDVWTRRCFEITACKTLMLAPRNSELKKIWSEGEEAMYFSSKEELLIKVNQLLSDDKLLKSITEKGYSKCINSFNSEIDRAKQIISNGEFVS